MNEYNKGYCFTKPNTKQTSKISEFWMFNDIRRNNPITFTAMNQND